MLQFVTLAFSYLRLPMLASSGFAAILSCLLYFKQNAIIYPRNVPAGSRTEVLRPSHFGISKYEELLLLTPDGVSLAAFLIRPSNPSTSLPVTLIMFHGNAGNIGHRLPIAKVLEACLSCNILMLQYRGYGLSTGSPSEKGLHIDAQTALDYVLNHPELRNTKIVLYGQSLGGAVAIYLASQNMRKHVIRGVILENTFLSIRKMIPAAMPPARYLAPLCHQIWPNEKLLPCITDIPILFLSGLQDEIVPPSQLRELYHLCQARVKVWTDFPNGSHNETFTQPGYFEAIHKFITAHVMAK